MAERAVHHLLDVAAGEHGDRTAVVDREGRTSYADLSLEADRWVSWLLRQGVRPGDRVVHAAAPDRSLVALLFATSRLGAVLVPLHPDLTPAQRRHVVEDCGARLVLTDLRDVVADVRGCAPLRLDAAPDAPALLVYTSGTTGRPKGVVCPHRQVLAARAGIGERLGYRRDDVVLCRLPLAFDYGLYQVLLCTAVGATLVLTDRDRDLDLLRALDRHRVTVVPLVPSLARMLLLLVRRDRGPDHVRLFTNTGARLAPGTARDLLRAFPGSRYASMYGMTECKRISILDPDEFEANPESVGPAIPGDTVRILDAAGNPVAPGQRGEIVVSGATVMAGYWGVPPAAQERFRRGDDGALHLHTGDSGYLDEDGRLYFTGRDDDVVKRYGVRIGLLEVEAAAEAVPGVEAAVALRPLDDGAEFHLALRLDARTTVDDVRRALEAVLDHARMPNRFAVLDEVPLTRNGKPDRAAVAALTLSRKTTRRENDRGAVPVR